MKRYKVRPSDIQVIYNPIDLKNINEKVQTSQMDPSHKKLFETQDKVILTAGRLVAQKDQKTLLKAFAQVNEKVKSQLVILGEGELKEELTQLAANLKIKDQVHFIGFQTNPYIYFKQADLFVLSSKHEGFGHVIAEALATGVPVVSTNCKSGPSEVLENGVYGELCEVGNVNEMASKMLKVLTLDEDELSETISKGYERAHHFDAKQIVKQYEELFIETLMN